MVTPSACLWFVSGQVLFTANAITSLILFVVHMLCWLYCKHTPDFPQSLLIKQISRRYAGKMTLK